ncbi:MULTISPECIES: hypothetical protein [unclassified Burkholderia]|uniref:hypothetical protein n=1 Tax=unclassified Burkholderia TaxID=2613784 RepID=UPI0007528B3D|nr:MULTISPECIES: hypothetical protein [unclassified Burkholderia]KVN11801.1 hypothetical protein WT08_12700 [Burkholderia sp. MSMB1552]KWZ50699.1 hypothetical protein WS92_25375 [Burkholderia sp. MSMB1588]
MNTRDLLALWERAAVCEPDARDDALLAAFDPAPPASLGARNAALLGLRARLFGGAQRLRCACPACGVDVEFAIDCAALSQQLLPAADAALPQRVEADGHRIEFRVPDVRDLRAAARAARDDGDGDDDGDAFARALLARCVTRCERDDGGACAPASLPVTVADALSRRMEALEPGASVSFELDCPACGASWSAGMDCGDVLWRELQVRAERLLLDVDALARAYGWSEAQVLALSPTRRAAYLQLAGAA